MYDPQEVEQVSFKKSFMGGYNEQEVDNFIFALSADYKKLYNENADLKKKMTVLVEKIEEYRQQENSIKNAVLYAQKLRDDAISESELKSKEIIEGAEKKAKELIDEVEIKAASLRSEEEKYLKSRIEENRRAIEKENGALNMIKKEVSDFKLKLQELYKQHLKTILSMPDYEEPVPEKTKKEETGETEEMKVEIVTEEETIPESAVLSEISDEDDKEEKAEPLNINKKKVNLILDIGDMSEISPVNIDFKIKGDK